MRVFCFLLLALALIFIPDLADGLKCYVCKGENYKDISKLCKKPIECGDKTWKGECEAWYFRDGGFKKECARGDNLEEYCDFAEGSFLCSCPKDNCNIKENDPATCTACGAGWNKTERYL